MASPPMIIQLLLICLPLMKRLFLGEKDKIHRLNLELSLSPDVFRFIVEESQGVLPFIIHLSMINYVLMPFFSVSRGRKYIYIEESQPDKVNQTAQLSSPFIRGPKCLRFSYRLSGRHVGRLDVLLQVRGRQGDYLTWSKSGDQGSQWIMASVDIGYTDECQVHTL